MVPTRVSNVRWSAGARQAPGEDVGRAEHSAPHHPVLVRVVAGLARLSLCSSVVKRLTRYTLMSENVTTLCVFL